MLLQVKLTALDGIESEWRALNEAGGGGLGGLGGRGTERATSTIPAIPIGCPTALPLLEPLWRTSRSRSEMFISDTKTTSHSQVGQALFFEQICMHFLATLAIYLSTLWKMS